MYIIYYLLSIGSFLLAIFSNLSVGAVVFFILMALVFLIIGTMSILSARLDNQERSQRHLIDPNELRLLREQAERNKQKQNEENS
mgnify:CR=1 FL=1